ncbi:MAG: aminopeptidase [Clostridiales bacterium]
MKDPRIKYLANKLINYSVELKKDEKILIENTGDDKSLVSQLIKEVYKVGAKPFISLKDPQIQRLLLSGCDEKQIEETAEYDLIRMKAMDAYIGIRGGNNINEIGDTPSDKLKLYMEKYANPVHLTERVNNTKWCVLRYPNSSMAQLSKMSTEKFEDYYFKVCNLDYRKMSKAMDKLVELMNSTDKVKLTGKNTNLEFSIKGLNAIKCDGKLNIPDGEVYTAPLKDSVNGIITYNCQSSFQGTTFENIRLEFKDGKIIDAKSNDTEKINKIFDTDSGARYIGEFAIGLNPYILNPMNDTLFDEKISGSIHFTPGQCYDDCNNGNTSSIHWDLVMIQRPEYGGGDILFDDRIIRKNGIFVIPELESLNPQNLL